MSEETLFNLASFVPGPVWLALIFFATHALTMKLVDGFLILYTITFALLVIPGIPELLPIIAEPEFETMRAVLNEPKGFVGTWIHMILGDVWIGRWLTVDAIRNGDNAWIRAPFILTTLFFGPLGLCCYLIYRGVRHKKVFLTSQMHS